MAEQKLAGKVVVCMPLYGSIPVETFTSFFNLIAAMPQLFDGAHFSFARRSIPHLSRRAIAENVLQLHKKEKIDLLLWIDADQVFTVEDVVKLFVAQKRENADIIAPWICHKQPPYKSVFYKKSKDAYAAVIDVPDNAVFDLDAVGFGMVLMKMDVLQKLSKKYGLEKLFSSVDPKTGDDIGEDILFCKLAQKEKFSIKGISAVKVGHAGAVIYPSPKK